MRSFTSFHAQPIAVRRDLARHYADLLGVAVFPVCGKVPIVSSWAPYSDAPGNYGTDDAWARATGYAVAPVVGSRLVIIDLDDFRHLEALRAICPALGQTFTVTRGPEHLHLYCNLAVGVLDKAYLTRRENNREVASIRGTGAYVVGPESDHSSGDPYIPNDLPVITLTLFEQTRLLEWFNAPDTPDRSDSQSAQISNAAGWSIPLRQSKQHVEARRSGIEIVLRARGYRQNGEWLNGPCIHPEKHKHNDQHASFGVNLRTGVGKCFACGNYSPGEVAAALGVPTSIPPKSDSARPYAFVAAPAVRPVSPPESTATPPVKVSRTAPTAADDKVQIELNIANALIRMGKHAAARLNDLLYDDSRRNHGQVAYRAVDLDELGKRHHLSHTQIVKGISALCQLGLLVRVARGLYRRVSVEQARILLGLGNEYALVEIPRAACMGTVSVADYTAAVVLEVELRLPRNLPSSTIADAVGISTPSLYTHEKRLKVERKTRAKRVNVATATPHFAKVFDDKRAFVATMSGDNLSHRAIDLACRNGGQAWGWEMQPSIRTLPDKWSMPERTRRVSR